jgi:hypothetical protein
MRHPKKLWIIGTLASILLVIILLHSREGFDDYLDSLRRNRGYSGVNRESSTSLPTDSTGASDTHFCPDGTVRGSHLYNDCKSPMRTGDAEPVKTSSALLSSTYYCPDGTVKSAHKYNNCRAELIFPATPIDNPFTTRELADGQRCTRDNDCYSKKCSDGLCTSDVGESYWFTWFTSLF